MSKIKNIIYIVLLSVLIVGCTTKTPYTQRNQMILISKEEELALGAQNYNQVLEESKVIKNTKDANRIKSIGEKIAAVANKPEFNWEFNLVKDDAINAFCLPGGKVVVYTGIMSIAKNDDQLATVMSHEIAHAIARHGAERMSTSMVQQGIGAIGQIAVGSAAPEYSGLFSQAYGITTNLGVVLPYGRLQENEADEIGIYLMAKAGYDVNEALDFWKRMSQTGGSQVEFLSTHPSSQTRIENIKKAIQNVKNNEITR